MLEAIASGTVTVSGSDVWAGWTADGSGAFTHAWNETWGLAPIPGGWDCCVVLSELARRREMVFVNGTRMRQVVSASAVTAGTFHVSESNRQVRLAPPAGVNLGAATVEVAQRSALVMIQNRSNVVLRGIRIQHDASGIGTTGALSVYTASNILLEDLTLDANNSRGLSFADTSRVSVRGTSANDNGFGGVAGWKMRSTLIENTQALRNNWRGLDADFTDWDPAGVKLMLLHDAALVGVTTSGNQAYGLWLDTDCADVLVRGLTSNDNLNDGVFLEAIEGPVTIDNATLSRNGRSGLLIGNAAAGTLTGSTLIDNRQMQVLISGTPAGRPADNFETGQVYPGIQSVGWTLAGNTFHALTTSQSVASTTLPSAVWQAFVDSLTSDFNSWYHPTNSRPFVWTGGLTLDFEGWKSRTQQDQHSVFAALRVPRPPVNVRLIK
ncbi:MAG: right-handed parallel beta-helix repeat-containing protein [Vicinamibacterales bacterium]